MKSLAVIILMLITVAASKRTNSANEFNPEDLTAFDYFTKIGIPLAEEIRKSETRPQSKITGGSTARLGEFPYQVGLLIELPQGQGVCGGSILSQRKVLTAAHCWYDGKNQATKITVVAGSLTLYRGGHRQQTSNVVTHENWTPNLIRNDIAMITMNQNIPFSDNIAAIALPSGSQLNDQFVGATATASGYGRTGDDARVTRNQVLSHVDVPVISNSECRRSFSIVTSGNICTSGADQKNICSGDSGGPLVVTSNNKRILIGASSFGSGRGCQQGAPGAFVRITAFIDWINDHL